MIEVSIALVVLVAFMGLGFGVLNLKALETIRASQNQTVKVVDRAILALQARSANEYTLAKEQSDASDHRVAALERELDLLMSKREKEVEQPVRSGDPTDIYGEIRGIDGQVLDSDQWDIKA